MTRMYLKLVINIMNKYANTQGKWFSLGITKNIN